MDIRHLTNWLRRGKTPSAHQNSPDQARSLAMRVICIHIVYKHYQEGVDAIPRLGYEYQTLNQLAMQRENAKCTFKQPRSS